MNGRSKSPCLSCTRVANPLDCENKQCKLWQKWFLARWALIHAYPRKAMDKDDRKPSGVPPERRPGCHITCKNRADWLAENAPRMEAERQRRAVVRAYRRQGRK